MSHPIQITIFIGSCVIQNPANNPIEKKKKAIAQTRFIFKNPFCTYLFRNFITHSFINFGLRREAFVYDKK